MTQSTFDSFTEDPEPDSGDDSGPDRRGNWARMSDNAVMTTFSCPWCLEPEDNFEENDMGETYCPNCNAVIPTSSEWYLNGEKVFL